MNNNREVAYALLRVTLGLVFLTTGLVKLATGAGDFTVMLEGNCRCSS